MSPHEGSARPAHEKRPKLTISKHSWLTYRDGVLAPCAVLAAERRNRVCRLRGGNASHDQDLKVAPKKGRDLGEMDWHENVIEM